MAYLPGVSPIAGTTQRTDPQTPPPAAAPPPPPTYATPGSAYTSGTPIAQQQNWAGSRYTYDRYLKTIAANPNYVANYNTDKVGWIVQNYGAEWLTPDGKAPQEAVWTNHNGISSATGISTVPWGIKGTTYDPMNGQDYSQPQYANGPGMPSGGLQGTPEQVQADRDRFNILRNGGTGYDPRLFAGLSLNGPASNNYTLPDGTQYTGEQGVTMDTPWGVNASYSGPGGSWSQDYWGKPIPEGQVGAGYYPGQTSMENLGINGFSPQGARQAWPGGTGSGGGQSPYIPPLGSGYAAAPPNGGTVPAGKSPYISLPQGGKSFSANQAVVPKGPWMQTMDNTDAMTQQAALIQALRGNG